MCRNVFLDFGANVGDSSSHLINSGMVSCDRRSDLQTETMPYDFKVATHTFEFPSRRNAMVGELAKLLEDRTEDANGSAQQLGPEDYCYYGIEGNPTFTKRLQDIEDVVMEHLHFFTESVGAGQDGMTKLYLDTVNTKVNFYGSSLMQDHGDVQNGAAGGDVEKLAAPVMGYTIATLVRKTLRALGPSSTEAEKMSSHLIIKMDIEGGEHFVLPREDKDGTLCALVKMGNAIDVYLEWHGYRFFGRNDPRVAGGEAAKTAIRACVHGANTYPTMQLWQTCSKIQSARTQAIHLCPLALSATVVTSYEATGQASLFAINLVGPVNLVMED
jgi:Methyltransferase FkbM domain